MKVGAGGRRGRGRERGLLGTVDSRRRTEKHSAGVKEEGSRIGTIWPGDTGRAHKNAG